MSDIKIMVRGAYDIQKLRIMMGNRIVANFKAKLGQKPGMSEEELEEAEKTILGTLRASYKKITDGVTTLPRQSSFKGDEVISSYTELVLVDQYLSLEQQEDKQFNLLRQCLHQHLDLKVLLDQDSNGGIHSLCSKEDSLTFLGVIGFFTPRNS